MAGFERRDLSRVELRPRCLMSVRVSLLFLPGLLALAGCRPDTDIPISDGGVPTATGYRIEVVAEGLFLPWSLAWLPDGTALITEKRGTLRTLRDGELGDPIDFPAPLTSGGSGGITEGQGGLLDIAVSPTFNADRLLYFTYATGDETANRTTVGRGRWANGELTAFETIWQNPVDKPAGQHFGSRLVFIPDGTLVVSVGDGGNPPVSFAGEDIRLQAQNPVNALGSTIRLNPDGSIPEDNPDFGVPTVPGLWTYGHRNIQGMARDPETGEVWANEHGAFRGDELNLLRPGRNFGWPAVTFSRNYYVPTKISDHVSLPEMEDAKLVWMKTNAPSGLAVYRGSAFPRWNGAVLSGSLKTKSVRVIRFGENQTQPSETHIPINQRVRDVRVGPDGWVYVLTDATEGQLLRIVPEDT